METKEINYLELMNMARRAYLLERIERVENSDLDADIKAKAIRIFRDELRFTYPAK